jgi:hypothetical protein
MQLTQLVCYVSLAALVGLGPELDLCKQEQLQPLVLSPWASFSCLAKSLF